jgi:hypothetical protein
MSKVAMSFTFGTWGLGASPQLVLKSLMNLLGDRLQQNWRYVMTESDANTINISSLAVDLLFVSSSIWQTLGRPTSLTRTELILVGPEAPAGLLTINYPFRPLELEQLLIRAKQRLEKISQTPVSESQVRFKSLVHYGAPTAAQIDTSALAPTQNAKLPAEQKFRLKRWPPASLIGSLNRAKLATMIVSQGMSAEDLSQASGQTAQECELFLQQLWASNMLDAQINPLAQLAQPLQAQPLGGPLTRAAEAHSKRGLLAMIRARLGLR